jgi:hypothetical protein
MSSLLIKVVLLRYIFDPDAVKAANCMMDGART